MKLSNPVNVRLGLLGKSRHDLVEEISKRSGKRQTYGSFTQMLNGYTKPRREVLKIMNKILEDWEDEAGIRVEISNYHFEPIRVIGIGDDGREFVKQEIPKKSPQHITDIRPPVSMRNE